MADVDFTQDPVGNGNFGDANGGKANGNGPNDKASDDRKIFIGGLSWETREPQLKTYFEKFGDVESVNLKLNPMTGRSRCFAFVVFKEPESVNKVFDAGDHAINSKKVDVKRAKAKPGKMFIGGLKAELTDDQIKSHFEQYGTIVEFEMPFDKVKKQRKGFGFITFEKEDAMKDLVKKGKETVEGHELDLKKATPKADTFFPGGGQGGNAMMGGYGGGYDSYGGYDYYGGAGGYGGGDFGYYGGGGAMGGYGQMGGYGSGGYGGAGGYGGRGGGKMSRGRGGNRGRPY